MKEEHTRLPALWRGANRQQANFYASQRTRNASIRPWAIAEGQDAANLLRSTMREYIPEQGGPAGAKIN